MSGHVGLREDARVGHLLAQQIAQREQNATIVFIVCDRGDRYLSTGVFPA